MVVNAMDNDDALSAEAILLEGLEVNSKYENQSLFGERSLTLLHWAGVRNAVECAKVKSVLFDTT